MDFKEETSLAVGAADGKRPSVRLIRRSRLKEWLAGRSLAGTEKAYLTKLVKGECAFWGQPARQIENEYGMLKGHLDGPQWDEVAILGDRIKALRKGASLTQKQLAEIVGSRKRPLPPGSAESAKCVGGIISWDSQER